MLQQKSSIVYVYTIELALLNDGKDIYINPSVYVYTIELALLNDGTDDAIIGEYSANNSKTKAAIAGLMKNDKIIGIFAKNPKTGEIIDELKYDDDRVLTKSELLAFFQRETIEVGPDILIRYNRGGNISTSEPIEAYDKRTLNSQGITSTKVQLGITCRNKFNFRFVFARPAACVRLSSKYLIFLFCTFLFINPLCNLSIFTLVPGSVTFALSHCKKETTAQNAVRQSRPII